MTSASLNKLFRRCALDAEFKKWHRDHAPAFRTVYLCEYGTFWRFNLREWWEFVLETIRRGGSYDLPLSHAMAMRPRGLVKTENGRMETVHPSARCVYPADWTIEDWKRELHRAKAAVPPACQSNF